MFLRRRGDLDLVMAQLGGELFAGRGDVDKYFITEVHPAVDKLGPIVKLDNGKLFQVYPEIAEHMRLEVGEVFNPPNEWGRPRSDETTDEWYKRVTESVPMLEEERQIIEKQRTAEKVMDQFRTASLDRVKNRILIHLRFAPEREAAALLKWASGYCDGLDRALRIARREE